MKLLRIGASLPEPSCLSLRLTHVWPQRPLVLKAIGVSLVPPRNISHGRHATWVRGSSLGSMLRFTRVRPSFAAVKPSS